MIVSDEYYFIDNENLRLVKLFGSINEKHLIINNILKITARGDKTTLFNEIKKGFDL